MFDFDRPPEMVALEVREAERETGVHRGLVFDSLGDRGDVGVGGMLQQRPQQGAMPRRSDASGRVNERSNLR